MPENKEGKETSLPSQPEETSSEETQDVPIAADPVDKAEVAEEKVDIDNYDEQMQALASRYGLDQATFQNRLTQLAFKYGVSIGNIQFSQYLLFNSNGRAVTYDIINQQEVQ
nr:hypothetical protein [Streptococcus parauberis]